MGRVGDEIRLALEQPTQALGELVQGVHQGTQLALNRHFRQGPQVVDLAFLYRQAQLVQRAQCGAHRQPDQYQRRHHQQHQAPQAVHQQAAGQALAGALGLGHANLGDAIQARLTHRLQQADDPDANALVFAVVEARQGRVVVGALRPGRRRRQVLVARDQFPVGVQHLVEDPPGAVVGEDVQRHIGYVGLQPAITLVEAIRDRPCRGQQGAVVRGIGGLAGVPVGTQAGDQQQRAQHQRQAPQQAPAQAAGFTHPGSPAGSPGRGR
ncbi:hypothetical protein D9M71_538410 [compost metagenome]